MTLKILCCGMNRTGTTSLHQALEYLGYRSFHFLPGFVDILNPPTDWNLFGDIEAVSDGPWFHFWREIYDCHRCQMILTTRDPDAWYNSMVRHIATTHGGDPVSNAILFGSGYPQPTIWKRAFQRHAHVIQQTIPSRDLLVLDITAGQGWGRLAPFLTCPAPNCPFPHIP